MDDGLSSGFRLARNTAMLYFRMIVIMLIGLFTSRVVLASLGIDDYGTYTAVGGIVAMFSILTNSLGTSISRYITFELGHGDHEKLKRIFSTSVNIQLLMSLAAIILVETVGLWFLNTRMNIPAPRMCAARWVLHCSLAAFVFNLVSVPYNAAIIAHEKMDAFAYISILEAVLKLSIAYLLYVSPFDKLKTYALLYACVGLLVRAVYSIYSRSRFQECRYSPVLDKGLFKEMAAFAGWNVMGTGITLFNTQGINIITNIFFNVAVNAARGVVTQVEGMARQVVNSFTTALNPQITKSYASGDIDRMNSLVCKGAKFSYLLLLLVSVPIIFEAETLLGIWLKEVPEHSVLFLRLALVGMMCDVLGNSSAVACWATGDVKRYYIWIGSVGSLVFFITWALFAAGLPAFVSYVVYIIIYAVLVFVKILVLKRQIGFPAGMFVRKTILRIIPVTLLVFAVSAVPYLLMERTILRLFVTLAVSVAAMGVFTYSLCLDDSEREFAKCLAASFLNKISRRNEKD